jgi:hypothetical protein
MKTALQGFATWAPQHATAPCPELSAITPAVTDPWGTAMRLSCTDQPSDQMAGVVSAGPDATFGTADDVRSWELGRDVWGSVRGARWTPQPVVATAPHPVAAVAAVPASPPQSPAPPPKPASTPRPPPSAPPARTSSKPTVELDENGLPVAR